MLGVAAATSAFAAGVGYVNFDALIQAHKNYPKATAQMQNAVKKAQDEYKSKSAKMTTDPTETGTRQQTQPRPQ